MKQRFMVTAVGGALLGLGGAAVLWARKGTRAAARPHASMHRTAGDMQFEPLLAGVSRAVLWGNPDRGPYAAFTRFEPDVHHRLHTHPHDISMVVLSGAYLYGTEQGTIRVAPLSFFLLPGGVPHWSGGDTNEGCLFFETSLGSFGADFSRKSGPAPALRTRARCIPPSVVGGPGRQLARYSGQPPLLGRPPVAGENDHGQHLDRVAVIVVVLGDFRLLHGHEIPHGIEPLLVCRVCHRPHCKRSAESKAASVCRRIGQKSPGLSDPGEPSSL